MVLDVFLKIQGPSVGVVGTKLSHTPQQPSPAASLKGIPNLVFVFLDVSELSQKRDCNRQQCTEMKETIRGESKFRILARRYPGWMWKKWVSTFRTGRQLLSLLSATPGTLDPITPFPGQGPSAFTSLCAVDRALCVQFPTAQIQTCSALVHQVSITLILGRKMWILVSISLTSWPTGKAHHWWPACSGSLPPRGDVSWMALGSY